MQANIQYTVSNWSESLNDLKVVSNPSDTFVTNMCRNDELSWLFTNRLSAAR